MRIIFAGGGTGGPVAPMIAVAHQIKKFAPQSEFLFIGTKTGPERVLTQAAGFDYTHVPTAKWRRYFSVRNFLDAFSFVVALFKSRKIISEFKPDLIYSVGGFVSVPVAWAAHWQKIKIIIHQQDAEFGLSNRLVSPYADIITTAFEQTAHQLQDNPKLKNKFIQWVGNPVREEFLSAAPVTHKEFGLNPSLPVILITGGASGSRQLNAAVEQILPQLVQIAQVFHIVGGKNLVPDFRHENYQGHSLLTTKMPGIMKLADVIVCRSGLSTIAELSVLGKPSIIVPIPNSHQVANAKAVAKQEAALTLINDEFSPEALLKAVSSLLSDMQLRAKLSAHISTLMPHNAAENIAQLIIDQTYANRHSS